MAYKTKTSKRSAGWYAFSYSVGGKRVVKGKLKPVRTKTRALAVARRMSRTLGKKVTPILVSSVTKRSLRAAAKRRSSKRKSSRRAAAMIAMRRMSASKRRSMAKLGYRRAKSVRGAWVRRGSKRRSSRRRTSR